MTQPNPPAMKEVPIGLSASGQRKELDSMGDVEVPADRYWGAQTQRSLIHFSIGNDRMPKEVCHAYDYVKKACALVNQATGPLPQWKADAIVKAADDTIARQLDGSYPLYVWQTVSGTRSNMNVTEVISNRCIQPLGGEDKRQHAAFLLDARQQGTQPQDWTPIAERRQPQRFPLRRLKERPARGGIPVVLVEQAGRPHTGAVLPKIPAQRALAHEPNPVERGLGAGVQKHKQRRLESALLFG